MVFVITNDLGETKPMKLSFRKPFMALASALFLMVVWGVIFAPSFAQEGAIYGRQLMTAEEIAEHQAKMRSFQTAQEREAYRLEHHQRMQQRAETQGVTLPDAPMERGKGMGMGQRQSNGMGMGMGRQQGNGMERGKP
jgi:hypothetical protein